MEEEEARPACRHPSVCPTPGPCRREGRGLTNHLKEEEEEEEEEEEKKEDYDDKEEMKGKKRDGENKHGLKYSEGQPCGGGGQDGQIPLGPF